MATKKYRVDTDQGSYEVEVEDPTEQPTPISSSEPDTFMGGFTKSLKDQANEAFLHNPMIEGAAHPETAGDFASLLIPSELGMGRGGMSVLKEFGSRSAQALGSAASESKGIKGAISFPFRAYDKFKDALPSGNEAAIDAFRGGDTKGAVTAPSISINSEPDVWDRVKATTAPTVGPKSPRLVKNGGISLEDALAEELSHADEPMPTHISLPTDGDITPGGPFRQSGKFGKSGSLGQPGGYSSGNPATRLESVDRGAEAVAGPEGALPSGGAASPSIPGKPKLTAAETAEMLRRLYGSRDASGMLFGSGGDTLARSQAVEAVKRLAPGPSQMPLAAEARINAASGKAASEPQDILGNLLAQILRERGGQP